MAVSKMHLTLNHEEGEALGIEWEAKIKGGSLSQPSRPHPASSPQTHTPCPQAFTPPKPGCLHPRGTEHINLEDLHLNLGSATH